ncbi:MAG: carboxypeptidase-like regulatory domain-containing protein [Flavobacterium sp.]
MKTEKLFYLVFLIGIPVLAQVRGIVIDASGKPIPYVNIWVEDQDTGTTSEENGTFSLNAGQDKNIVFSALGYEKKILKANEAATVSLIPKITELNEVVIEKRKGTEEAVVGDFSGIKLNSGVTNTGQENVHVWGKLITFNDEIKKHPFVKSIEFVTRSHLKNVLMRIRVFNINKEAVPTGDAVDEGILVTIQKGKNSNTVDLSKYNIRIPEEGIIFGFEYLKLDQNRYEQSYTIEGQKGVQKAYSYEPSILGFAFGGENLIVLDRDGTPRSSSFGNIEIALKIKLTN